MEEIQINQNDNQEINIISNDPQFIRLSNNSLQDININLIDNQDIKIKELENQILYVEGNGNIVGITDVEVNGVSVVSNNIAYVLVPTKTSELINDSNFITNENDPTVPSYVKQISIADINSWNNKQNTLVSGSTIKTINDESILGSGNISITSTEYTAGTGIDITNNEITNTITSYNDLTDLPTIPTQTSQLENNSDFVTSDELSDVAFSGSYTDLSNLPDIPTDTSDLNNDSGFITKDVNDLTYYTLSSNLSSVATSGDYDDLTNKPTIPTIPTNISSFTNDVGYITSSNFGNFSTAGTIKSANGLMINSGTGNPYANTYNYSEYTSHTNEVFIGKGTLENALTGKGYITNTVNNLTNYTLSSNLSTVATSGNYSDLSGTPTNYSTTETRIGTWINGKPIYRQVIETTTPSTTSAATLGSISNLGIVTNLYGLLTASGQQVPLNFIYNTSDIHSLYTEGNNIMCKINYSSYLSKTCFIVIEYTKTTD